MSEEKRIEECDHDFDSNEESAYCGHGCGETWYLFEIKECNKKIKQLEVLKDLCKLKDNRIREFERGNEKMKLALGKIANKETAEHGKYNNHADAFHGVAEFAEQVLKGIL
jgi:hypothetical protein